MTNFFSLTDLGLAGSASSLLTEWLAAMQAAFPGYSPSAANLEYIQAQILAAFAADLAQLCGQGSTELFRVFGTSLVGVPYQQGVAAQAVINVAAQDSLGTIATTSGGLSTSGPTATIPVVALAYGIAAGSITITDPTLANSQTFTTTGANSGDTSVSITSATPNFAYPPGSTLSGTQLYAIPSLSQFTLDQLGFQNLSPVTIPASSSANITLTAVQSGAIFNGAGSGGSILSVQQLDWVSTISLVAVAAGGQDPESDPHYLNRLATALQLQAPRPITAADFGVMALNFEPFQGSDQQEVGRATAVDGYNPSNGTYNNARMVTIAVTDDSGLALNNDTMYGYPGGTASSPVLTLPTLNAGWGIAGWLQSLREINFIVNVIAPTYSNVYVTATVKAQTGWDAVSIQQNVQSALLAYLSPASWGLPTSSENGWQNVTKVYQSHLMSVVQSAAGVDYVLPGTLAFGLNASPANTTDLPLPGPVALPTSSFQTIPLTAVTVV